ncbi:MAG: PQQ-binding-like beta-propeller repeat protein [Gammaproteobacteria bacterium]
MSSTTRGNHPASVSVKFRSPHAARWLTLGLALAAPTLAAHAGGSNYGISPGARDIAGQLAEWLVPTPQFARDPTPAPDGRVFLVAMAGNRLARFDPATEKFEEWELPANTNPHSVLVDGEGVAWLTGKGNGTIVEFHPDTGETVPHRVPSGGDPHTAALDDNGVLWFTEQAANRIGSLDRGSGAITEYQTSGTPYGLSIDQAGNVWFCRIQGDMLGKLDPGTGAITDVPMGKGSAPRRIATAPDGTLWVALWGNGKLAHVDPATAAVINEYPLPGGSGSGPYAVTVDAEGKVFVNEFNTDVVVILDPRTEAMRSIPLPTKTGIRKMVIDQAGSLWYVGSSSGRLGRID